MFIDSFSTSLEDMSKKDKADICAVFDHLLQNSRFSTFEIEGPLCRTVTDIFQNKYMESDITCGYPWTDCVPTEKGILWRAGLIQKCTYCEGRGFIPEKISTRFTKAKPCRQCGNSGYSLKEQSGE